MGVLTNIAICTKTTKAPPEVYMTSAKHQESQNHYTYANVEAKGQSDIHRGKMYNSCTSSLCSAHMRDWIQKYYHD